MTYEIIISLVTFFFDLVKARIFLNNDFELFSKFERINLKL